MPDPTERWLVRVSRAGSAHVHVHLYAGPVGAGIFLGLLVMLDSEWTRFRSLLEHGRAAGALVDIEEAQ